MIPLYAHVRFVFQEDRTSCRMDGVVVAHGIDDPPRYDICVDGAVTIRNVPGRLVEEIDDGK